MARIKTVGLLAAALLLLSVHWPTAAVSSTPVDLQNDPLNCGATSFRAPAGQACHGGEVGP